MDYNGVEGLGDTIYKITKATGIKKVVKTLNGGSDCEKCEERRKRLNKKYPYNK